MTDRERLIDLIIEAKRTDPETGSFTDYLADYLLEHGVIVPPETGIGDVSDGYHTFNELYHHRAILFSVICNTFKDKAWKSKKHDTGDMFDGMFIVGIETPQGQATYHYDINSYWDMFKVKELPNAPEWDGHTPEEAIRRISILQADNVIVPSLKLGDTVYIKGKPVKISFLHIENEITYCVQLDCGEFDCFSCPFYEDEVSWEGEHDCGTYGYMEFTESDIGKTVFITREEAEKALKESADNV